MYETPNDPPRGCGPEDMDWRKRRERVVRHCEAISSNLSQRIGQLRFDITTDVLHECSFRLSPSIIDDTGIVRHCD
jgi:hypothetical protein